MDNFKISVNSTISSYLNRTSPISEDCMQSAKTKVFNKFFERANHGFGLWCCCFQCFTGLFIRNDLPAVFKFLDCLKKNSTLITPSTRLMNRIHIYTWYLQNLWHVTQLLCILSYQVGNEISGEIFLSYAPIHLPPLNSFNVNFPIPFLLCI